MIRAGQDVMMNLKKSNASQHTPKNLLSLSNNVVWHKTYCKSIFIIAEAKIAADGFMIGSMQAKPVMPQQPIRYESDPSNPACLPAAYALKCITRNGASIQKLYTSLDDFPRLGLERVHPRHA
jgi:hypothetical protein